MFKLKEVLYFTASVLLAASVGGCANANLSAKDKEKTCIQDGVKAPSWVCKPEAKEGYAALGISKKSDADLVQRKKAALKNARESLAKEMQFQVKNKLEKYSHATGFENKEALHSLLASISKQITKVDLVLLDEVKTWTSPVGTMYRIVVAPKSSFDEELKSAVKQSYAKDKVAWQHFQSEESLENLEKVFAIETLNEQSHELPSAFQVEVVDDMQVVIK